MTAAMVASSVLFPVLVIMCLPNDWLDDGPAPKAEGFDSAEVAVAPIPTRTAVSPFEAPVLAPSPRSLFLMTEVDGQAYVILAGDAPSTSSTAKVLGDIESPSGSVSELAGADLPAALLPLLGTTLIDDLGCEIEVSSVVALGLLVGDPGYAGAESSDRRSALAYLGDHGRHYYAVSAGDCSSEGKLAHPASATKPAMAEVGKVPGSWREFARHDLESSALGLEASKRWQDNGYEYPWTSDDALSFIRATHPRTGVEWMYVQASSEYGCGGAGISLVGIYRIENGKPVRHAVVESHDLIGMTRLVDVDDDGIFEVLGWTYLSGPRLMSSEGETLQEIEIPFYGCPC